MPRVVATWLFPFVVMLALHLFLRGHDLPGGGFAAGIVMTIAFTLQYMARGAEWVEARLRIQPILWIGAGLLIAVLTGAGSWLFDRPFLTASFAYWETSWLGKVPIASALLFDLGIMILVVGASALMLVALATSRFARPHRGGRGRARRRIGRGDRLMELILSLGIGILAASGVWLMLRPRTFRSPWGCRC